MVPGTGPQGRGTTRPAPGAVPSTAPTTNTPRCSDQASSSRGGWDSTRRRRGADTGAGPRGGARVGCHEQAHGQGLTGAQRRGPGLHPALAGSLCRTHPLIGGRRPAAGSARSSPGSARRGTATSATRSPRISTAALRASPKPKCRSCSVRRNAGRTPSLRSAGGLRPIRARTRSLRACFRRPETHTATASGAVSAGSNPAGGTQPAKFVSDQRQRRSSGRAGPATARHQKPPAASIRALESAVASGGQRQLIVNCVQWDIALDRIDAILRSQPSRPASSSRCTSTHGSTSVIAARARGPSPPAPGARGGASRCQTAGRGG